jgi:hypothetical protein
MEMLKTLKDKIMGTDEQNKAASERMKNNPMEKKFQKMMGNEPKDEKEVKPVEKAKGGKVKKYAEGGLEDTMSSLGKKGAMAGLKDAMSAEKGAMAGLKDVMSAEKGAMAGLEDAASGPGKRGAMAGGVGMKKGGKVSSASKRADGCCIRGKTRA